MISKFNNINFDKKTSSPILKNLGFIAILLAFSALVFANPLMAQQDIDLNEVVAIIDGEEIIEADIGFAAEDLGQELANIPADQQRAFLISVLIDMKILAKAAREAKMQKTKAYQIRLNYLEDRALRRAYFTDNIGPKITPEAIKAYYDELASEHVPVREWRAKHILVASLEDAQKIIAEMNNGKAFEVAAMEYSSDSGSAKNGGDLGYFRAKDMVAPFEAAVKELKVGEISEPIKTDFGWHIIRLGDDRMSSFVELSQVQGQLQQQLLVNLFNKEITELKDQANIEISDPNIAIMIENQQN